MSGSAPLFAAAPLRQPLLFHCAFHLALLTTNYQPLCCFLAFTAHNSLPSLPSSTSPVQGDRFIPNRGAMNFESASFSLSSSTNTSLSSTGESMNDDAAAFIGEETEGLQFRRALAANLVSADAAAAVGGSGAAAAAAAAARASMTDGDTSMHRILAFKQKAPAAPEGYTNSLRVLYTASAGAAASAPRAKPTRHIPSGPDRILDAPGLVDDFYLNLVSWSCNNIIAVALGPTVYLWNAGSGAAEELCTLTAPDDCITSVAWMKEGGGYLAVGTSSADVMIWDTEAMRQVRSMRSHAARVGSLDWNSHVLSSGSRDTTIHHHDVRIREHHTATLTGHTQEVCGLKWSPDGTMLASGSNDNTLAIWAAGAGYAGSGVPGTPRFVLTDHHAAVKALAWCPWQRGLLASGGGTADRTIKTWNATTGSMLTNTDTGSQVCSLQWNPHERELLSSHGFVHNQLTLWKYPSMTKVKDFTGHTARVLHTGVGPDGSTLVSVAADETMRFWRIFGEPAPKAPAAGPGAGAGFYGGFGGGAGGPGGPMPPPPPAAGGGFGGGMGLALR